MAKAKIDVYQSVTDRIIESLENGCAPWVKPWAVTKGQGCSAMPYNAISANNYSGVNVLLLWGAQMEKGFSSNTWLTYKQATDLGGNVIKGQKGCPIVFYKMIKRRDEKTGEESMFPMLKQYTVFNIEQTENIDSTKAKSPDPIDVNYTDALELAERIGATVQHGGDSAFFSPAQDFIQMPPQTAFEDAQVWDSTLLHELTHWTGHKSRLERTKGKKFGDDAYAFEELIAELGSAYLGHSLGLPHENMQHDSYIASWLKALKSDKKAIFAAAKQAQTACNYVIEEAQKAETVASKAA